MKHLKVICMVMMLTKAVTGVSQNFKTLSAAFSESYDYEAILKYDAAISTLTNVYSPTSYELNLRLGWLHYLSGKYKESLSYYKKASALMPAANEPRWAMVDVLTKQENWTEIEKIYLAILKIDAKNATANYNLGMIYYYRKDYFSAKKRLDVALNLSPFNYNYMLMSAWTNYFLGSSKEAALLFNKVLLYSPNDKSALEGLSLIK